MSEKNEAGQWTVIDQGPIDGLNVRGLKSIASVSESSGNSVTIVIAEMASQENAALIAACPDLLDALNAALPALIRLGDFVGNVDEGGASGIGRIDRCALIRQARAALAKAKGLS